MIYSVTGHRPDKILLNSKNAYNVDVFNKLVTFCIFNLIPYKDIDRDNKDKDRNNKNNKDRNTLEIITGMAQGFDMAMGVAAIKLNIKTIAAIPFRGQELKWPVFWQDVYNRILSKVNSIKVVSRGNFSSKKYLVRNEWMIDNSDRVLAFYNNMDVNSGTGHCIRYAESKDRDIDNWWDKWNVLSIK